MFQCLSRVFCWLIPALSASLCAKLTMCLFGDLKYFSFLFHHIFIPAAIMFTLFSCATHISFGYVCLFETLLLTL